MSQSGVGVCAVRRGARVATAMGFGLTPSTGFTRSQGPRRFESFWVNKMPRYIDIHGIPCA